MRSITVDIAPHDKLNAGFGYALIIKCAQTDTPVLIASRHPITMQDLDFRGATDLAGEFARVLEVADRKGSKLSIIQSLCQHVDLLNAEPNRGVHLLGHEDKGSVDKAIIMAALHTRRF